MDIAAVRCRSPILRFLRTLCALLVLLQSGASLALAVHAGWHEAVHHHHGGSHEHGSHDEDSEEHDCPVVQLAHGFWVVPAVLVTAVPQPPAPSGDLIFPDTAQTASALVIALSVLEHAPPTRG